MNRSTITLIVAATLALGVQSARAEHEKDLSRQNSQSAKQIIGTKVTNAQDEDLGEVQDIIVNVEAGTAPCAVIAHGGLFGAKRTKTAVPLSALKCSEDGKKFVISATKEQLKEASKTPTGSWAPVADSTWARNVDAYYGEPTPRDRFTRDTARDPNDARTYVRDPAPKGAELLMTPQDSALCERICDNVDVVHVRVQNGVTHIYGQVESEAARRDLEARVRAVPGVNMVESHVKVKNP